KQKQDAEDGDDTVDAALQGRRSVGSGAGLSRWRSVATHGTDVACVGSCDSGQAAREITAGVVGGTPARIGQDRVRRVDRAHLLGCFGPRVQVRMVGTRQATIGGLNLLSSGVRLDFQYAVEVD